MAERDVAPMTDDGIEAFFAAAVVVDDYQYAAVDARLQLHVDAWALLQDDAVRPGADTLSDNLWKGLLTKMSLHQTQQKEEKRSNVSRYDWAVSVADLLLSMKVSPGSTNATVQHFANWVTLERPWCCRRHRDTDGLFVVINATPNQALALLFNSANLLPESVGDKKPGNLPSVSRQCKGKRSPEGVCMRAECQFEDPGDRVIDAPVPTCYSTSLSKLVVANRAAMMRGLDGFWKFVIAIGHAGLELPCREGCPGTGVGCACRVLYPLEHMQDPAEGWVPQHGGQRRRTVKRKATDDGGRPAKRSRGELCVAVLPEGAGAEEARATAEARTEEFVDNVLDLGEDPQFVEVVPRVRGPAEDRNALLSVLVRGMKKAGTITQAARKRRAARSTSDEEDSEDSESGDEATESGDDETEDIHVIVSAHGHMLIILTRAADMPEAEWETATSARTTFNPLLVDACCSFQNPSKTLRLRAHLIVWDARGYSAMNLARHREVTLAPGETFSMKDSSFIISAPEDDKAVDGYFVLFYQWCTEEFNPEWFAVLHPYRLLPDPTM